MNPQWNDDATAKRPEMPASVSPEERRAGMMPMLVGGLMVAVGLLAFLFYDDRPANRDVDTTASTRPAITEPAKPAPDAPAGNVTTPARP